MKKAPKKITAKPKVKRLDTKAWAIVIDGKLVVDSLYGVKSLSIYITRPELMFPHERRCKVRITEIVP